jgi:cytochrome c peroxidase
VTKPDAAGEHEHVHEDSGAPAPGSLADAAVSRESTGDDNYQWSLPAGFPVPWVPASNPMSAAKVQLGRFLFYDKRLSDNQTQSCASCHKQELAFSDGRKTGLGSTGQAHPRSPMPIVNVAYASSLTWANPLLAIGVQDEPLERQSELPMYGQSPVELGLKSQTDLESRLQAEPRYQALFAAAFPESQPAISAENTARALAAFERTLISGDSRFDRYQYAADDGALSAAEKRGYQLFFGEKLECFHCHAGFNFSDHVHFADKALIERRYHNTGLYNIDGKGAYPESSTGVFSVTDDPKDMGMFKAPTLRNIAVTAPYMHDGSIASLSEVLDHYAAGGRTLTEGPYRGVGKDSPLKDKLIRGFALDEQERADVIAFLQSLTDEQFLANVELSDPWLSGN